jgi:hypothetical protein
LLESTLAIKQFRGNVWAQGAGDMILTPIGNSGNYFSEQDRRASRLEWLESYGLAPIKSYGTHNIKFGTTLARTTNRGRFIARPIDIRDSEGRLLKRIEFAGGGPFDLDDLEVGLFGQDHWSISSRLALDLGTRLERQGITQTYRFAPRAGLAWTPFNNQLTIVRGGFGIFYDRVPLSVYAFDRYPEQIVTTFGPNGEITDGPRRFANITDRAEGRQLPFIRSRDNTGNFAPYSATWNIEVERVVSRFLRVRANYLQSNSAGVIILTPRVVQGRDALVLGGGGKSRYRQFETTARITWREGQQVFLSYVRSRARGDINEFNNYLGNFPFPVVRPDTFTNLPGDMPNRFLGWGLLRLPWRMRIAPILEYRNGFPYTSVDALQNFVGTPNKVRFPNFLSLDSRVSKDFQINQKYALRFSVSGFNLTNHFNPLTVHANVDDPRFGTFFGNHKRRFRLDFDVIF